MAITFIRDTASSIQKEPALMVNRLYNNEGKPRNRVYIAATNLKKLSKIHDKMFNIYRGRYVQSELGIEFGAEITSSSFTINVNGVNLKKLACLLGISTVVITRHLTI